MEEIGQQALKTCRINGYEVIRKLGQGACSEVYLAQSTKYKATQFVIKKTDLSLNNSYRDIEIKSLLNLNHPNIISIFDHFSDQKSIYVVLEYCPNGDLLEMLEKVGGPLNQEQFFEIAIQLLRALNHCHIHNIAHRDIKPQNILIDAYNRPKLADFGVASHYSNDDSATEGNMKSKESRDLEKKKVRMVGSLMYMAPEIINGKVDPDLFKADIWSLGVTFFYLLQFGSPWVYDDAEMVKKMINKAEVYFTQKVPKDIQQFVLSMLRFDPNDRPTCTHLIHKLEKMRPKPQLISSLSSSAKLLISSSSIVKKRPGLKIHTFSSQIKGLYQMRRITTSNGLKPFGSEIKIID